MKQFLALLLCCAGLSVAATTSAAGDSTPPASGKRVKLSELAEAARFRSLSYKNENGVVPIDGLLRAAQQRDALVRQRGHTGSSLSRAAGVSSTQWTELGPRNIGGRTRTMVIHPTNSNKIWVGSVSGGIWTSDDAGATWRPVNDFMPKPLVTSLLINPQNPLIMYAGTGECNRNLTDDATNGVGVYKSTDGGVNWTVLPATTPTAEGSAWNCINRLAMHPTNPDILLAAAQSRWNNVSAIWRSVDGGATWTNVGGGTADANGAIFNTVVLPKDVIFDPNDGNKAIAGGNDGDVAYSTNAGLTWTKATVVVGGARTMVAYAKSKPGQIYASVDRNQGEIYSSTDGGATWLLRSNPQHLSAQGFHNNAIWVDPFNPAHLVVAGLDIMRSTDSGEKFTAISTWQSSPASPHADHHLLVSDPAYNGTTNRTLYDLNDGGVYRAKDISVANNGVDPAANGWEFLSNGLGITQFYGGSGRTGASPAAGVASSRINGGTQDNGTLAYSGTGTNWTTFFGGDGGYSALDGADGNFVYGEYVNLMLFRSTDGGASQDNVGVICTGILEGNKDPAPGSCGGTGEANFIAPFILDPNSNDRMLAGAASLWVSNNVKTAAPTWASIKPRSAVAGNYISAIAVAPGKSDVIWVGHNNGEVYMSSNGTAATPTWNLVSGTLPQRFVTRIHVDKDDSTKVYITYGGYSGGNVWRTANSGTSWTDISGALPQAPIRGFTRHPANANWLYVGSEVGVFTSEDGGVTWSTTNDGPGTVAIEEFFWLDNANLVAVTHGRGMFQTAAALAANPTAPGAPAIGPATAGNASASVDFGTPSNNGSVITGFTVTSSPGNLTATGAKSPIVVTGLSNGTAYTFTVTATNAAGTGAASSASNAVTPQAAITVTPPGAPTLTLAAQGSGQITVTITPPASNGGSEITGYTVVTNPADGVDASAGTTRLTRTITGLKTGVAYTLTARATNAAGTSADSAAVTGAPLAVPPGAPVIGTVTAGVLNASVSFTAPASDGGSAILRYTVTSVSDNEGRDREAPDPFAVGATSPIVVPSLFNGVPYTFTVTATNVAGTSAPSAASASVTLTGPSAVPNDPSGVTATAGNAEAVIGFTAPAANGSPITGYAVISNPGGITANGTASPIVVKGLSNGTAYTFSVSASNALGAGPASPDSNAVTPSATPAAGATTALNLGLGWNLVGNGYDAPFDVSAAFGDANQVTTVWKWLPLTAKWAFYTPALVGTALTTYAAGKGYDVLTAINGGEGYWVNAKVPFAAQLPNGTAITARSYQDPEAGTGRLTRAWNLISIGETMSPGNFNKALTGDPTVSVPNPINLITLWAWDNVQSLWYFYAPSLDAKGGTVLADYITGKGYLNFTTSNKTLSPATGFWVNKP